jgi:hypothetical protein
MSSLPRVRAFNTWDAAMKFVGAVTEAHTRRWTVVYDRERLLWVAVPHPTPRELDVMRAAVRYGRPDLGVQLVT